MSGGIKIPVSAELNSADLKREIDSVRAALNSLGATVAKANGAKFKPVDDMDIERVRRLRREFESLQRVSPGLRRRIVASGQHGVPFESMDWERAIPDAGQRTKYARQVLGYVMPGALTGGHVGTQSPHGSGTAASAVSGIAQAGLRGVSGATGGAGGVAAGAMGTGLSAGFGAGLMGLLGGLGALGIGKLAGAAVENLGRAEDNAIALDKLKRTLGDVNVAFGSLNAVIKGTAGANGVTYGESGKLTMQFVKAGNLSDEQLKGLPSELGSGIGLARSFGLDPDQGVGVLGRMRGLGVTRDAQDTRRFALLIGETIGKSNAFAKADEVMEAISDYATMQTRNGMGAANVAGFAGTLSGLIGSGIPGLDPTGAAGVLGKINAALMAGGAKGEASQFLTARVGHRLGLDPLQTQVLREGGAFATNDEAFGPGSAYAKYMGKPGPRGNTTHIAARLEELRSSYGNDPMMLAQATANDFGVNMRQAMALLSTKPNQMGEMGKYADLTKLSDNGIGNLSKALYGSSADRHGLAESLMQRTGAGALSSEEKAKLSDAMGGDEGTQKQVLAQLVASRDQERTQGSDIRDSKNILDNIKTDIASKLIPVAEQMRAGIIFMAGKDGKLTTESIMQSVIENDSKGRIAAIHGDFDPKRQAIMDRRDALRPKMRDGTATTSEREEFAASEGKIKALGEAKAKQLEAERARRTQEIDSMRSAVATQRSLPTGGSTGAGAAGDALFDALVQQESGGRHTDANGRLITSSAGARGITQLMPGTAANPGYGIKPVKDDSEGEYRRVGKEYLDALLKKYGGDKRKALAAYNAGPGSVDAAIAKNGANWLSGLPKETRDYVPNILERAGNTPMPGGAVAAGRQAEIARRQVDVSIDPVEIIHRDPRGQEIAPRQQLTTRVGPARPFGAPS